MSFVKKNHSPIFFWTTKKLWSRYHPRFFFKQRCDTVGWLVGTPLMLGWREPPPSILQVWLGTSDDWIGSSDRPTKEQGNPRLGKHHMTRKSLLEKLHGILESQRKQKLGFYLLVTFIFFKSNVFVIFVFFSYSLGGNEVRFFLVVVGVAFSGRFFVMCLLFKATFNLTEWFSAAVCSCVATSTFAWGSPSGDYC